MVALLTQKQCTENTLKVSTMVDLSIQAKKDIIEFANNDKEYGWHETVHDGKLYKFPKRALMWAVFGNSTAIIPMLPEYEPFCRSGFKMMNDNAFHSDVWLGAGFDLDKAYRMDIDDDDIVAGKNIEAYHEATYEIEDEFSDKFSFDFVVLANGLPKELKRFDMFVYKADPDYPPTSSSNIAIQCQNKSNLNEYCPQLNAICLPEASVKYDAVSQNAEVIITEVGGPLSHLATVSRESGKILIRVDKALEKFKPFSKLKLDLEKMTLKAVND